jgi:heat shock protein HtpX
MSLNNKEGFIMFKRIGLLLLTNVLVVATVSLILNLTGAGHYLTATGLNYESLAVFCLVWGMAGSFISLLLSKFMAKTMMGVQIVDANGPYRDIVQMVHFYAQRAKLPSMPEVGVYQSPDINAFATGPTKSNSLVAVSTGLLSGMSRDEIEGVIAHEVSHIANGDMVTMTLIQGVMNAFVMFAARAVTFAIDNFTRSNDDEGQGLGTIARIAITFVLEIIFGIFGSMVVAWFSRYREFRADAGSAQIAGKEKMINALRALQRQVETIAPDNQTQMASMQISSKSSWLALLSTHPSLEERITALQRGRH